MSPFSSLTLWRSRPISRPVAPPLRKPHCLPLQIHTRSRPTTRPLTRRPQKPAANPNNPNRPETLCSYCAEQNVIGISDLDTRALTKRLRETGCLVGAISRDASKSDEELLAMAKNWTIVGKDLLSVVRVAPRTGGLPSVICGLRRAGFLPLCSP